MAYLDLKLGKTASENANITREACFQVLKRYLLPDDTLTGIQAATEVNALAHARLSPGADPGLEEFLWAFWGMVDEVARQIPDDHPGQDLMVDLLDGLRQLEPTTVQIWVSNRKSRGQNRKEIAQLTHPQGDETHIWTDFPLMGPAFREVWQGAAIPPPFRSDAGHVCPRTDYCLGPEQVGYRQWVNRNAFLSRLFAGGIMDQTPTYAIWAMREALEDEPPEAMDLWETNVAAAAQWIEHAGRALRSRVTEPDGTDDKSDRVTAPGRLFTGSPGLNIERWKFWARRFEIASKDLASDRVKTMAARTVEKMTELLD